MSEQSSDDEERIRREAADWFARLRGEPAETDRAEFAAWRAADPRNAETYERLVQRFDQTAFLAGSGMARSRDLDSVAMWNRQPSLRRWAVGGVAALLIATVALFAVVGRHAAPTAPQAAIAYANATASTREIHLADGSTVLLDLGAAIDVRYSAAERRLRLVRGRARFSVVHDAARPFVVDADGGSIVAHGTVFDVAFEHGIVRVSLLRGSVEVRTAAVQAAGHPPAARLLQPGQQTTFASGHEPATPSSIQRAPADWPQGMVTFDGTSLDDAVAAFNRRNAVQLVVRGGVGSRRLSGAFRADDPAGFAAAAAAMFDLAVSTHGTTIEIGPKK